MFCSRDKYVSTSLRTQRLCTDNSSIVEGWQQPRQRLEFSIWHCLHPNPSPYRRSHSLLPILDPPSQIRTCVSTTHVGLCHPLRVRLVCYCPVAASDLMQAPPNTFHWQITRRSLHRLQVPTRRLCHGSQLVRWLSLSSLLQTADRHLVIRRLHHMASPVSSQYYRWWKVDPA